MQIKGNSSREITEISPPYKMNRQVVLCLKRHLACLNFYRFSSMISYLIQYLYWNFWQAYFSIQRANVVEFMWQFVQ